MITRQSIQKSINKINEMKDRVETERLAIIAEHGGGGEHGGGKGGKE